MPRKSMTRSELIASGSIRIVPKTITKRQDDTHPDHRMFTQAEHRAMTADVPYWIKPVKAPHLMSYEERDRYLASQLARWKPAKRPIAGIIVHEGLKAEEREVIEAPQPCLSL